MNLSIHSDQMKVVISSLGAELQSIQDREGKEHLWQGAPQFWSNRATNCFPMVGRLYQGRYSYAGQEYELPIHGFAKSQYFSPRQLSPAAVRFALSENAATLAMYPFAFNLALTYTLEGSTLSVDYEVRNHDHRELPYLLGGHPGFIMPLDASKAFSDYRVRFSAGVKPVRAVPDGDMLDTGEREPWPLEAGQTLPLSHSLFDHDAIFLTDCGHSVTLESDGGPALRLNFPDFAYLGLWHRPRTEAPYICLEPWTDCYGKAGQIEDFGSKAEACRLAPGASRHHIWSVTLL